MIKYFGIRHLSPACAYFLREHLNHEKPELVLVEGPSDLSGLMEGLVSKQARLPAAILAYTKEAPMETVLYPFSEFSPEYQAILWAKENGKEVRFCDLPSSAVLYHYRRRRELEEADEAAVADRNPAESEAAVADRNPAESEAAVADRNPAESEAAVADRNPAESEEAVADRNPAESDADGRNAAAGQAADVQNDRTDPAAESRPVSVYEKIEAVTGIEQDAFWEYTFEQCMDEAEFSEAMEKYGQYIREFSEQDPADKQENSSFLKKKEDIAYEQLRESYMRRMIAEAAAQNPERKIVVVTGAYHTSAVQKEYTSRDKERTEKLEAVDCRATLMPYSYYRLSEHSGYGAGAKSPYYYEILWRSRNDGDIARAGTEYMTRIAAYQRKHGYMASSAQVIEALRLAQQLALMHGGMQPALSDLRAGAVTCLGEGRFSQISLAVADTEIGTKIGSMPEGTVCTSVQDDFTRYLKEYKLEKYRSAERQELELDLRENLRVKSEAAAFLDLHRSFFLHRLSVLGIGFAEPIARRQDNATWAEKWGIRWTPEVEICIVEASLKGDTIEEAAAAVLGERLGAAATVKETTAILSESLKAGLMQCVKDAIRAVQRQAAGSEALKDIGNAIGDLSAVVRFGDIRRMDTSRIGPLLEKLFLKFCLYLPKEAVCDAAAAKEMLPALGCVWDAVQIHDFLDKERIVTAFLNLAGDDMANPMLSGFACGALTERGDIDADKLYTLMERHLSAGTSASDGAYWFEGFAERNHRALISRLGIWERLVLYIARLEEEDFKAAVISLRRAFSTFTPAEKLDIAENICEVLGISDAGGAAYVTAVLTEQEQQAVEEIDDFDFDL